MPDVLVGDGERWPLHITAIRGGELRVYVPSNVVRVAKATRIRHMVSRTVGHDECGSCGLTVGPYDMFCPRCGAELGEVVTRAEGEDVDG